MADEYKDLQLEGPPARDYPTGVAFVSVLTAIILGIFLVALDVSIVATAIPRIASEFGSLEDSGWYGSAFFMTLASFQGPWGKAYAFFTTKNVFLSSVALFAVGSLLCGGANSSALLIAGRAITGIGAAGLSGGCYTILALITPPSVTPIYIGAFSTVFTCASASGPVVGGLFTEKLTWRWIFFINLPICGITSAIILLVFRVPPTLQTKKGSLKEVFLQMDPIGVALVVGFLSLLLLALERAGIKMPWDSGYVVGTLMGAGILAIAFIFNQVLQKDKALLTPRLLANWKILFSCICTFFLNAANFMIQYNLPVYFQAIQGASPSLSGLQITPLLVVGSIVSLVTGRLYSSFPKPRIFLVGGGAMYVLGSVLIFTLQVDSTRLQYLGYQVVLAVGAGMAMQIPLMVTHGASDLSDVPSATALVMFFQLFSGAMAVSASQNLLTNVMLSSVKADEPATIIADILRVGASDLRKFFPPEVLSKILAAYMDGLHASWAMGIGLSAVAAVAGAWL